MSQCRYQILEAFDIPPFRRNSLVRHALDHFLTLAIGCTLFFSVDFSFVLMLTCEFIESHHQNCAYFLLKLSITLVTCVISRPGQDVTHRAKQWNYHNDTCLINFIIVKALLTMDNLSFAC